MEIYLIVLGVMSFIAWILYGADKMRAKRHRRRIRESVLLSFGFFGGALGALLGMLFFRHKTRHGYFWTVNLLGLLVQAAVLYYFFLR